MVPMLLNIGPLFKILRFSFPLGTVFSFRIDIHFTVCLYEFLFACYLLIFSQFRCTQLLKSWLDNRLSWPRFNLGLIVADMRFVQLLKSTELKEIYISELSYEIHSKCYDASSSLSCIHIALNNVYHAK